MVSQVITHWGRVTHICGNKITIIGSDNGLSPDRRQVIIWTNAVVLLIWPLGTNFSEIFIGIHTFSFKKIHLKMSSGKWRPFCFSASMCLPWSVSDLCAICYLSLFSSMCAQCVIMETFSALLAICAGNSPVTGEFPAQRSVTRCFNVFFDQSLNKRFSKQSWGWWFETPSRPLWRHSNEFKK